MRNKNKLLVKQLDKKLDPLLRAKNLTKPDEGWIRTIREALNMTMAPLGSKIGITRQGIKRIESSEANQSISLGALVEIADALGFRFVYGFVPKEESVEKLVEVRATELATEIVMRTDQTMSLEDQAVSDEYLQKSIKELSEELQREMSKSLWD